MNPGRWQQIANAYRELGVTHRDVVLDDFLYDPLELQDLTGMWRTIIGLSGVIVIVSIVAVYFRVLNGRLKKAEADKQGKIEQLRAALSEIRSLRDMLPICAACKKIRDDQGFWENVETYISKHTDTKFTHGICPGCAVRLYGAEMANGSSPENEKSEQPGG